MDNRVMARADFVTGLVLIVLAIATLYGSVTMPRLEERGIHPTGAPGVVPGLLAIALLICAVMLTVRSVRAGGHRPMPAGHGLVGWLRGPEGRRLGVALVLTLAYGVVLVGTVPFWLATGAFVLAFVIAFERLSLPEDRPSWRATLIGGGGLAAAAAVIVPLVFERLFLVRLP